MADSVDPPRPVWMTKDADVRLLQRVAAAAKAGTPIGNMDANALIVLADKWFSAPPDAERAVDRALHGVRDGPAIDPSVRAMQTRAVAFVLRALEMP